MSRQFLTIGECMLELSAGDAGQYRKGYAGDTFNAAFYARAVLPNSWNVDYLTAVGTDQISDEMLDFMRASGIATQFVSRIPDRVPGLYMIHLKAGERSFSYWRSAAAARLLARDRELVARALDAADVIVFTGITLAILEDDGAEILISELAARRRSGKIIAFDPNIRPRLWPDAGRMCDVLTQGARAANIVLPSFDDEATHFGDESVAETIRRYRDLGLERIIVKNGIEPIGILFDGESHQVVPEPTPNVVDTTSAGDSFNGSFLAHYAEKGDVVEAVRFAARVAAFVIGHHGALVRHDLKL